MIDYSSLSENELLQLVSSNDRRAEEELTERYRNKAIICSRRFYLLGGDNDDLIQEGIIGLIYAIRTFSEEHGVSFNTYAEICIKRKMIDATRSSRYREFISAEDVDDTEPTENSNDPEAIFLEGERYNELVEKLNSRLSKYERSVLSRFLSGQSFSDIASAVGKKPSSIYNAIERVRHKLAELI